MKGYVYILALKNGRRYYGSTRNVRARLYEHQKGNVKSTRGQNPQLLKTKEFDTLEEAKAFEMYLKKVEIRNI